MPRIILTFLSAIFSAQLLMAQNFYANQEYGGQATLMGGTAVVGGDDNSLLYYNPGGLGFVDSAKITASTYLYGVESVVLKNGYGNGVNLVDQHLFVFPQIFTFDVHFKKAPRLKLVAGTFTRFRTDMNINQASTGNYSIIKSLPGQQYYSANMQYTNNSTEQWSGVSLAYKFNKVFSAGFSYFISYTNIDVSASQNSSMDATAGGVPYAASVNEYNALNLNQVSQIFKLGFELKLEHLHFGLTITPPDIRTWSSASLTKTFSAYNLNQNATDTSQLAYRNSSFVISDVQGHLQSNYLQPFSFSLGGEWVQPKYRIAASINFYAGYSNRIIVAGNNRAVIHPSGLYGNDTINGFMTVQTSAIPIVNFGIGGMYKIKPKVDFLFGIRTDINNRAEYLPNNSALGIASATTPFWNYVDFSTGFSYKLNLNLVTLGADYGIGIPNNYHQIYDLTDLQQYTYLRGPLDNTMHTFANKLSVIISWTYFFKITTNTYPPLPFFEMKPPKKKKDKRHKNNSGGAIVTPGKG